MMSPMEVAAFAEMMRVRAEVRRETYKVDARSEYLDKARKIHDKKVRESQGMVDITNLCKVKIDD